MPGFPRSRDRESAPSILPVLLIGVIIFSIAGILAMLAGVPNPFSQVRQSTPDAQQFWAEQASPLVADALTAHDLARFAIERAGEECVPGGEGDACDELAARFVTQSDRFADLIARLAATNVPDTDPTIQAWVDAARIEWEHDRESIARVARVASGGYRQPGWSSAVADFQDNPHRDDTEQALRRMLPGRVHSAVEAVENP